MAQRLLEVTVLSGKGLNKVSLIAKMDVYIILSISGDKLKQTVKIPADNYNGSNPYWNFCTKFIIDEAAPQQNIVFNLKCECLLGDKDIGIVRIPINELLQSPEAIDGKKQTVGYQVTKPDGKPKGSIRFAYQFEKTVKKAEEPEQPTMVYPPPHGLGSSSSNLPSAPEYPLPEGGHPLPLGLGGCPPPPIYSEGGYFPHTPPPKYSQGGYYLYYPPQPHSHSEGGYPPPPSHYHGAPPPQGEYRHTTLYGGYDYPHLSPYGGHTPPPPRGNSHSPSQPGYGNAPAMQKPPEKKSKDGLRTGAELVRGAVGRLLIGNMITGGGLGDVGLDI